MKQLIAIILFVGITPIFAASATRGLSGCPPSAGLSDKEWVCLTREEAAQDKLVRLGLTDQIIDLKEENQKLRARVPTGLRKFVKPWATIGAEKLLNTNEYKPYGLAGLSVGKVDVWGGFFGDSPAAGVGWRW